MKIKTPRKKGGPVERDLAKANDITQIKACITRNTKPGQEMPTM